MARTSTRTRTYTLTRTRLDTIQDQFEHFLLFGNVDAKTVKRILKGVANQWVEAVGLYACNSEGERILEIELQVDWSMHGELVIQQPVVPGNLTGWSGTMAPEVKVAGRRFAELVEELKAKPFSWVRFTSDVHADQELLARARSELGYGGGDPVPRWSAEAAVRHDQLFDVPEVEVTLRSVDE